MMENFMCESCSQSAKYLCVCSKKQIYLCERCAYDRANKESVHSLVPVTTDNNEFAEELCQVLNSICNQISDGKLETDKAVNQLCIKQTEDLNKAFLALREELNEYYATALRNVHCAFASVKEAMRNPASVTAEVYQIFKFGKHFAVLDPLIDIKEVIQVSISSVPLPTQSGIFSLITPESSSIGCESSESVVRSLFSAFVWTCEKCGWKEIIGGICPMCHAPRLSEWQCWECNTINPHSNDSCSACRSSKSWEGYLTEKGVNLSVDKKRWICKCGWHTENRIENCGSCNKINYMIALGKVGKGNENTYLSSIRKTLGRFVGAT